MIRWWRGYRLHRKLDRFRIAMAAAGDRTVPTWTDEKILISTLALLEQQPQAEGKTAKDLERATIRYIEWATRAAINVGDASKHNVGRYVPDDIFG